MLHLGDAGLPTKEALSLAESQGRITVRPHKEFPQLVICNYTPQTAFSRDWDIATKTSRGLIVNWTTGEILALPLTKFHNFGETLEGTPEGQVLRSADPQPGPFEVTVKMDGSLGICYRPGDGTVRWATRGSFHSEQADAANDIWRTKYAKKAEQTLLRSPSQRDYGCNFLTVMAEILHPTSRVVVRYPHDDLVIIAARSLENGFDLPHGHLRPLGTWLAMPVVEKVDGTIDALIEHAQTLDSNSEGFVLRWDDGYRLKVKGERYKSLHRILTGFTPKRQGEAWMEGIMDDVLVQVPEEFRMEAEDLARILDTQLDDLLDTAQAAHRSALLVASPEPLTRFDRGLYARHILANLPRDETHLAFMLLDGREITTHARKIIFARNAAWFVERAKTSVFGDDDEQG